MKFKHYINEGKESLFKVTSKQVTMEEAAYNALKKNCSKYLSYIKKANNSDFYKSYLFRGLRNSPKVIRGYSKFKAKKTEREPRYISTGLHKILNDALFKIFGWKPRTEGIFTGDFQIALKFASHNASNVYMFAPIGNFKYIWRPEIYNLYTYYDMKKYERIPDEDRIREIQEELDEYDDKNLNRAFRAHNMECIVKCDSYYLVDMEILQKVHDMILGNK